MEVSGYGPGEVPIAAWMAQAPAGSIPDFPEEVAAELAADHPFLARGGLRAFLHPRARVLASWDEAAPELGAVGAYGARDAAAGRAVLEAAIGWLEGRGARRIVGPLERSIWYRYRMRLDGFEQPPFLGEPMQPAEDVAAFEALGFVKLKDYSSVRLRPEALRTRTARDARVLARLEGRGWRFEEVTAAGFEDELRALYELVQESFAGFEGFSPVGWEEFRARFAGLRRLLAPGLTVLAYEPGGRLDGFLFAMDDPAAKVAAMRGDSGWRGKLRYLLTPRRPRRVVVLFAGLRPEAVRSGASAGIAARIHGRALEMGAAELIHGLMAEGQEGYWARWQPPEAVLGRVRYRLYVREAR